MGDRRSGPPATSGPTMEWCQKYVTSISGILKILQMILSIVAFLCSVVSGPYWTKHGGGWVNFVAVFGFIDAIIGFVIHIVNFAPLKNSLKFIYVELISSAIFAAFFLIAGIVAAVVAATAAQMTGWLMADKYYFYTHGHKSVGAASFFCFACMSLWIIDIMLQFLELRKGATSRSNTNQPATESQYPGAIHTSRMSPLITVDP